MNYMSESRPEKRRVEFIESYWTGGELGSDYQWNDNHGELIRCRDCQHCYFASNRIPDEQSHACGKHGIDVTPDWFCADGKQKTNCSEYPNS